VTELTSSVGRRKPRLLDLFCREGGAAAGYVRAGWEVHGVDIEDHGARYLQSGAASFTQADATTFDLSGYDAVRASPPCQDISATMGFGFAERGTGWMLPHTVARFQRELTVPWEIENVESRKVKAYMPGAIRLCGSMFSLGAHDSLGRYRVLRRHRLFLTSFPVDVPPCTCRGKLVGGVYGHGEQKVNGGGGYGFAADAARIAMDMPWASREGCTEAIPPAYGAFLGRQLMAYLEPRQLELFDLAGAP
jgi:DNA (cytosine-5)-methyltransferase 1